MIDGPKLPDEVCYAPTQFRVSLFPFGASEAHNFEIQVAARDVDGNGSLLYAVCRFQQCWNESDGEWQWESQPSNRADEFKAQTRYPLVTALEIAARLCPDLKTNGWTARAALKQFGPGAEGF